MRKAENADEKTGCFLQELNRILKKHFS